MKAPISWLRDLVALPEGTTTHDIAAAYTRAGLNVERIDDIGSEISGPLVIGRVLDCVREPQKNGKTISWCHVDVGPEHNGPEGHRGIVCGAPNVDSGQLVVVALPGAVLPGGFEIAARKTYGHISDGMICAEDELGLGEDHTGTMELPEQIDGRPVVVGADALDTLGVRDQVLDLDITPDIGYCLSMRGLAREAAQLAGVAFTDPYLRETPPATEDGYPVRIEDPQGCSMFVALTISGLDPAAPTPDWMVKRLRMAGMRSISVLVDITNYVMLESGQPLHAYDGDTLQGPIVVRRARAGERLVTLDDQDRALSEADLLITDDRGPIGLAGVMGGAETEISNHTTTVVLEAAHFDPITIGQAFRRHKLPSEASKRFERTVDPALPYAAAHRAADLMAELAGGRVETAETIAGEVLWPAGQRIATDLPARILGLPVAADQVEQILQSSGVVVTRDGDAFALVPPTWRPDLADPYDYVEEVGRKIGFDDIPSIIPPAPVGRGLSAEQRARRAMLTAAVDAGFVELITLPFVSGSQIAHLGVEFGDPRSRLVRLANPLDDTHPYLRSSLLPGLFASVTRNTSRGQDDLALFEAGRVFVQQEEPRVAPRPGVSGRPSDADLAALDAALPEQPRMLAAVVTGSWTPPGWQGAGVPATWTQVVALAEKAAHAVGLTLTRAPAAVPPWHPGRCAELRIGDEVIGYAGELHPGVVKAFGLPARTAAIEFDLDALVAAAPGPGEIRPLSPWPVAKEDVALIVGQAVPAADVEAALRAGAGDLLESVSLFDIYTGEQVGEGNKSLAFALRFRAPDRTLTDAEAAAARDAAVAEAAVRTGAFQRT